MRNLVIALTMLTATDATACIRNPLAYSFEDKITNEFAYLICLHNEQNDALRRQADVIEDLAREITQKDTAIRMLENDMSRLKARVQILEVPTAITNTPAPKSPEEQRQIGETMKEIQSIIDRNQPAPAKTP